MKKIGLILTLNLFLMIFGGCANKTVYNQGVGAYLPSESEIKQPDIKKTFTSFRKEKMEDFVLFCDNVYTKLENLNKSVDTYGMTDLKVRSKILYDEPRKGARR